MAGRGREALQVGWEGLGGPPGRPGGFKRPSRKVGWGREVLPEDREGSGCLPGEKGGHPGGPGRVGRPFWRAGRDQEVIPEDL